MDVAYVSALSALARSVVGGLTAGITSWLGLRTQARAGQLAREMSRRDDLYKDFIVAASKAWGEAIVSNEPQMQELVALYTMISRMRVVSLPRTLACAEKVVDATIDTYFAANKTIRELHEMVKRGGSEKAAGIDPLKEFTELARAELQVFTSP